MAPPLPVVPEEESTPLPVRYVPAKGAILLLGEPAWFVTPDFYLDLQNQLEVVSGRAARGILYRAAFSGGFRMAKRLAKPLAEAEDPEDRLRQIEEFLATAGYGRYTYRATDAANAETEWILPDSTLARMHARSREPVCHLYEGFLAGWLTVLFDRPVECVEVECRAKGDDRCLFRTKPAPAAPI